MKDDVLCLIIFYEVNIGDSVVLCCFVSGNLLFEVEWTFNDVKVKEFFVISLVIIVVRESNYGFYYCIVRFLEKVVGLFFIILNKM